jgi:SpoVK/Ycf46/Vps4 family AAA+-type ATPase
MAPSIVDEKLCAFIIDHLLEINPEKRITISNVVAQLEALMPTDSPEEEVAVGALRAAERPDNHNKSIADLRRFHQYVLSSGNDAFSRGDR